jgi:hypothetical protein
MRLPFRCGALAALVSLSAACAGDARFPYRYYNLTEMGLARKAELIVVGRTKHVQRSAMTAPAEWTGQPFIATVRLLVVTIAVENIIKGSVKSDEVSVSYWAADDYTNAHSLSIPAVGERAVHYLVSDKGSMRYVTDVIRSKTVVRSGLHRDQPAGESAVPEVRIAGILLTPGDGFDPREFVVDLGTTVQRSLDLIGFMGTLPLLNALLDRPDLKVQEHICAELYRQPFLGQDSCLDILSPGDRQPNQELQRLRAARVTATLHFKTAFLANPVRTAREYSVIDGPEGTLDFLRLLARHPDKQIAARAQSEIETCCKNGSPAGLLPQLGGPSSDTVHAAPKPPSK